MYQTLSNNYVCFRGAVIHPSGTSRMLTNAIRMLRSDHYTNCTILSRCDGVGMTTKRIHRSRDNWRQTKIVGMPIARNGGYVYFSGTPHSFSRAASVGAWRPWGNSIVENETGRHFRPRRSGRRPGQVLLSPGLVA